MTLDLRDVETKIRCQIARARMYDEPQAFDVYDIPLEVGPRSHYKIKLLEWKREYGRRVRMVMP